MKNIFTILFLGLALAVNAQSTLLAKLYEPKILATPFSYYEDTPQGLNEEVEKQKAELSKVKAKLAQKRERIRVLEMEKVQDKKEKDELEEDVKKLREEVERLENRYSESLLKHGEIIEQYHKELVEAKIFIDQLMQMNQRLSDSLKTATATICVLLTRLDEANKRAEDFVDTKRKEIHIGEKVIAYKDGANIVCGFAANRTTVPNITGEADDYLKRLIFQVNKYGLILSLEGSCNYRDKVKTIADSLAVGRAESLREVLVNNYGLNPNLIGEVTGTTKCKACNCVVITIKN